MSLQTVVPTLGRSALAALDAPHPPPLEALLTTVLNDLAACADPVTLSIDDDHFDDGLGGNRGIREIRG